MSVCRLLQCIGGLAILVGIGTIAYAHLAVSPELHRSVDVARRAVNDAATALVMVSQSVEATEALRPPTAELTHRNLAVLKLTIALLEGLPETLRLIPSAGGTSSGEQPAEPSKGARPAVGLAASLTKLGRAVAALTDEAQGLRKAAVTLEEETARHPMPTFRPAVAAAAARVRETQADTGRDQSGAQYDAAGGWDRGDLPYHRRNASHSRARRSEVGVVIGTSPAWPRLR
jgi:hypothetical protein